MAISDFVLLYNKAAEALAKSDRLGHDLYTGIADTKGWEPLRHKQPSTEFVEDFTWNTIPIVAKTNIIIEEFRKDFKMHFK